ncbi:uncharacterized protein LOC116213786 isoform X2 [Punica granatum]|uniref:Uncharacterized protein LOC116213786 isoform X2 n=1 Tax=Punica granatum TaxID=22663 RepID=A0A6P8EDW5_PUNGR|nr:uncharacterized protein LOC116213786 isoform X2 [Punica granatum]
MKKNFLLSLGVQTVTNALECHNLTARESTLVGIHAWRHGCLPACSLSLSYDVPSEARSTSSPVSFHLIRHFALTQTDILRAFEVFLFLYLLFLSPFKIG